MDIQPNNHLLKAIPFSNLIDYLKLNGWVEVQSPNDKWLIYQGVKDNEDNPLDIVLIEDLQSYDGSFYLSRAINLLSALSHESPEQIIKRVKYYDRDVLTVRNVETGGYDSIPFDLATIQITSLKNLVAYSACSTQNPQPYFDSKTSIAAKMVHHYRLGQTFVGSFGLTVESPIRALPGSDQAIQLPLAEQVPLEPPLERRVMERIMRGLIQTQQATTERNIQKLVDGYKVGFNGNMCESIVTMSGNYKPLEYSVMWSPKVKIGRDLQEIPPIVLTEMNYNYLASAVNLLREAKLSKIQTIKGRVTELVSENNPLGDSESQRSVVIKWQREEKRAIKIIVTLNKQDYLAAIDAHKSWDTVMVTGIPDKVGQDWVLANPQDFRILNQLW